MLTGATVTLPDLLGLRFRLAGPRRKARAAVSTGGRLSRVKGRGVDLDEVRLYQPGDDIRNIDWKVTARKSKPHTKVFREERERPTLILIDQTRSMFFGSRVRLKSVAAAELGARIAWHALEANDRVGALVIGDTHTEVRKPHRSSRAVGRILAALASANAELAEQRDLPVADADLWQTVPQQISRIARVNHRIVIVSDLQSIQESTLQRLVRLSQHNRVELVYVFDELERTLPPADIYAVRDGRDRFDFDSSQPALRESYHERFESRIAALTELCVSRQIIFQAVATDTPMEQVRLDG